MDAVRVVRLDEAAYRAASFLDERILRWPAPQAVCSAALLGRASADLTPAAHYIFHIGHVGSTLLSRLLGEDPRLFCVREPALLRSLAQGLQVPVSLRALLALLSRTWRPGQRAVIKATSFASEVAGTIMEATPGANSVLMYTSAVTYLRGILGGENSRLESRTLAPFRLARLRRRLEGVAIPEPASEGESIAMSWLCEMTSLCRTEEQFAGRVHWVEFEKFLVDPSIGLANVLKLLGVVPDARTVDMAVSGPIMRQYSKAPEHGYDPALRQMVLESADRQHGDEVRKGLRWLGGLAAGHRLIDRALALQ